MRFALIDNKKVEAKPKVKASCPGCFQPVIAKCGSHRIHHWAHHNSNHCDTWWEPETEWHRTWKENFPNDWQEIYMRDEQTKEIHIADIRTSHNIVIEFQHSHIDPVERASREKFYQNLVWVVDGTRLKRDMRRFFKEKHHFILVRPGIFRADFPEESFPSAWIGSSVPVILDFMSTAITDSVQEESFLYCMFPKRIGRSAVIAEISRRAFIKTVNSGEWLLRANRFLDIIDQVDKEQYAQITNLNRMQGDINFRRFTKPVLFPKRRRL